MTQPDNSSPFTFCLVRKADVSGTSGTGHVADGVQFPDGTCVLRWRTARSSTAVYSSHADLMAIHGHDGATVCEWAMAPADVRRAGAPASGAGERWAVDPNEEQIWRSDSVYFVSCDGPVTLLRDIAARLNGPSPAEVAALSRSVEWPITHKMDDGYSFRACAVCNWLESDGHADDCKLSAVIKQCEGA
mgnify:CR=1 FL=1